MSGCTRWKSASRGISQVVASVGTTAIWMLRPIPLRLTRAKVSFSICSRWWRMRPAYSAPDSVNTMRRRTRVNNSTPSKTSRLATCLYTALCVSASSSAAREKLPRRADASKACKALKLGTPFLMKTLTVKYRGANTPEKTTGSQRTETGRGTAVWQTCKNARAGQSRAQCDTPRTTCFPINRLCNFINCLVQQTHICSGILLVA